MRLLPLTSLAAASLVARSVLAQAPPAPLPSAGSAPGPLPQMPSSAPSAPPSAGPPPTPPVYAPPAYGAPPPGFVPPYPPPGYAPYYQPLSPPAPAVPPDAHSHAGFFLRMGLGGGRMTDSATIEGGSSAGKVDASGGALSLELDIGGALTHGLILAGSYSGTFLSNAKLENDTRLTKTDRNAQFSLLGVMVDGYPNPRGGFHVGGVLGLASVQTPNRDVNNSGSQDEGGFGFAAHVGYEWWVGNYWGLGVLGRFAFAGAKGDYLGGTATDKVGAFTLLFSATYN